jgi:hypothetical protein
LDEFTRLERLSGFSVPVCSRINVVDGTDCDGETKAIKLASAKGTLLPWRDVRYLIANGVNLLQNDFGTQSEERFFESSPL